MDTAHHHEQCFDFLEVFAGKQALTKTMSRAYDGIFLTCMKRQRLEYCWISTFMLNMDRLKSPKA